jgi:ABC-type transporter Mla subunit MlaD
VDSAKQTVDGLREDLEGAVEEYRALARDLAPTAREIKDFFALARKRLEELETGKTQEEVHELLETMTGLAERLQGAVDLFETASRAVAHDVDTIQHSMRTGIETIREAFEALRELVEYLQEDPSALVRGKGKTKGE